MAETGLIQALIAGSLSFATPCLLPVLPFYLCLLTGLPSSPDGRIASPDGRIAARLSFSLCFAAGLVTVFLLTCPGNTAAGRWFLASYDALRLSGVAMLSGVAVWLLTVPPMRPCRKATSAVIGAATGLGFGFGWIPCIGATLAALLRLAAEVPTTGIALLTAYGLGMALPFLLLALIVPDAERHRAARMAAAAALGILAALIATGSLNRIAEWMLNRGDWSWLLR